MKPFAEWPEIMTPEDIKKYIGIGHVDAYKMFNRPDFPLIDNTIKRGKRVGKFALRQWLNKGVAINEN